MSTSLTLQASSGEDARARDGAARALPAISAFGAIVAVTAEGIVLVEGAVSHGSSTRGGINGRALTGAATTSGTAAQARSAIATVGNIANESAAGEI